MPPDWLIEFRLRAHGEPCLLRLSRILCLLPRHHTIRTLDHWTLLVLAEDWPKVEQAFRRAYVGPPGSGPPMGGPMRDPAKPPNPLYQGPRRETPGNGPPEPAIQSPEDPATPGTPDLLEADIRPRCPRCGGPLSRRHGYGSTTVTPWYCMACTSPQSPREQAL